MLVSHGGMYHQTLTYDLPASFFLNLKKKKTVSLDHSLPIWNKYVTHDWIIYVASSNLYSVCATYLIHTTIIAAIHTRIKYAATYIVQNNIWYKFELIYDTLKKSCHF